MYKEVFMLSRLNFGWINKGDKDKNIKKSYIYIGLLPSLLSAEIEEIMFSGEDCFIYLNGRKIYEL